jgi:ribonuclease T2
MRRYLLALLLIVCACAPAYSRSRRRGNSPRQGQSGDFDYYVLSLSWSPDFCAAHKGAPECGGVKRFGFVVHGLWPQFERGFPKGCQGPPFDPTQIPADLHNIMPSDPLIQHEWESHGTCSGLPEKEYFQRLEKAYGNVNIPADYKQPLKQIEVAPSELKQRFAQANSSFPPRAFSVQCSGNRFLSEVRVCLTKDLQGRACSASVHDTCNAPTVILRPLR